MKNTIVKSLIGLLAVSVIAISMTACNNTEEKSNIESSLDSSNTSITETSHDEINYTTYRIIVDDSFLEKPFIEQYQEETSDHIGGTLTPELWDHSAKVVTYIGYVKEEDDPNVSKSSEEITSNTESKSNGTDAGKGVLIIAKDVNNLTELNNLTSNDDYSETTINDGTNSITVKTGLTYKNELYIILEDNVAVIEEHTNSSDKTITATQSSQTSSEVASKN